MANGGVDLSGVATITVNVTAVNDRPIANNATVGVLEDVKTAITLTGEDGDVEVGQSLTFILRSLPATGTLSQTATGPAITPASLGTTGLVLDDPELFFLTATNDVSQQTFQFQVRDDGGVANGGLNLSLVAAVTVNVTPVNDKPTGNAQTLSALEDVELAVTLTGNDGDPEVIQALTFILTSLPTTGSLSQVSGGLPIQAADLGATGLVLDDPQLFFLTAPNAVAQQMFTFEVMDDGGVANGGIDHSADPTITINITPVNDQPIASSMTASALEDVETAITVSGAVGGGADEAIQSLTFILTSLPATGSLSQTAGGPAITAANLGTSGLVLDDPELFFLTALDDFSQQTFQFKVRDNGGTANGGVNLSLAATVTVNVTPVNDAPTADDDVYRVTPAETLSVLAADGLLDGDSDVDTDHSLLTAVLTAGSGPTHGVLELHPDGSFDYTPDPTFSGTDSFVYQAYDGQLYSNEATVLIHVNFEFRNPINNLDVNADGFVSPVDAVLIINALNVNGGLPFTLPSVTYPAPPPYFNTSGSELPETVSAVDALAVINYLNLISLGGGEGESSARSAAVSAASQPLAAATSLTATAAPTTGQLASAVLTTVSQSAASVAVGAASSSQAATARSI